jgi:hypothetical protein
VNLEKIIMAIEVHLFFKPRGRKSKKLDWLLSIDGEAWDYGVVRKERIPELVMNLRKQLNEAFSDAFGEKMQLELGTLREFRKRPGEALPL